MNYVKTWMMLKMVLQIAALVLHSVTFYFFMDFADQLPWPLPKPGFVSISAGFRQRTQNGDIRGEKKGISYQHKQRLMYRCHSVTEMMSLFQFRWVVTSLFRPVLGPVTGGFWGRKVLVCAWELKQVSFKAAQLTEG